MLPAAVETEVVLTSSAEPEKLDTTRVPSNPYNAISRRSFIKHHAVKPKVDCTMLVPSGLSIPDWPAGRNLRVFASWRRLGQIPLIEVNRVRVGGIEGEADLWSWVEAEESERKCRP